jgi:DNA-directed RNA polymerase specialized sigma24 family protein
VRAVLDEELGRLPDKYAAPVVLCYLHKKTYAEAARAVFLGAQERRR